MDLALLTQDKEVILCHSIVAAANSICIQKCLESYKNDIPQTDSNYTYCVQLSHVNKNVTARIVGYFYTGIIEFTASESKDLLFAANALRITGLKNNLYCLLSVVLNNYVIKQIAVKSIHKLILFIEQK